MGVFGAPKRKDEVDVAPNPWRPPGKVHMVTSSQFRGVRSHVTALLWGAGERRRTRCRSGGEDGTDQR